MDVDDILEPGERVIWRGRPRGWLGMTGCEVVVILAILCILGLLLLPPLAMACEQGARPSSSFPWWRVDEVLVALGPVGALIAILAATMVLLLAIPMVLVGEIAYAVTDRRVLVAPSRWGFQGLPRSAVWRARVRGRSLEIEATNGRKLRFDAIDDPEAARDALLL
jgi:hypothetical protein